VLTKPGSDDEASGFNALLPLFTGCGARIEQANEIAVRDILIGSLAAQIALEFGSISSHWAATPDLDVEARLAASHSRDYPPMAAFAYCLMWVNPDDSARMVKSRPGSSTETRSMAALQSSFARCTDQGAQMSFTKSLLRTHLVRAYVRHICNPSDALPQTPTSEVRPL